MEDIKFQSLGSYPPLSNEKQHELNIFSSEITRKAREKSKGEKCLLCGKECTSFCSSHSVPKFVLNAVASNGLVFRGMDLIIPSNKPKPVGIGNALTFTSICRDCDSDYFQEYENLNIFEKDLTNVAINEIAMKNYLRYLDKRINDLNKYKILLEKSAEQLIPDYYLLKLKQSIFLAEMDISDYKEAINKLKSKKNEKYFYIIDEINLNYNAKFAYQGFITLINGFDETLINDVYNYDKNYNMQRLGVAIFPSANSTKIVLFCKDGDTRLRPFYKKYRKLSFEEKLYSINYLLLLYQEEWCIPGDFKIELLNEETMQLLRQTSDAQLETNNPFIQKEEINFLVRNNWIKKHTIQTTGRIYNFLINGN